MTEPAVEDELTSEESLATPTVETDLPKRDVTSPKRGSTERSGLHAWHPYYAGFSEGFVADILAELSVPKGRVVLDPMNGSGTTTLVAQLNGYFGIGIELNPAMAAIARAKDATIASQSGFDDLVACVIQEARVRAFDGQADGQMTKWIPPGAFADLKRLQRVLSEHDEDPVAPVAPVLANAFARWELPQGGRATELMRAALLITARRASTALDSKNPTWLKPGHGSDGNVEVPVFDEFASVALEMMDDLRETFPEPPPERRALIDRANAKKLPLSDATVDAIVTSPPYLTRIDYAVGTAPELVLLGFETESELRGLRVEIMGSTCVTRGSHKISQLWGPTCLDTVDRVSRHSSKASSGYYLKMHIQYFRDAESILRECLRVLRPGAPAVLVVQDSWYKDIHIQLGKIYVEMALQLGATTAETIHSEAVKTHLGHVNTRARRYKKGTLHEHVVMLRR